MLLYQRVNELQISGPPGVRGQLTNAVAFLRSSLARPLGGAGPFTVFVIVDNALLSLTPVQVSQIMKQQSASFRTNSSVVYLGMRLNIMPHHEIYNDQFIYLFVCFYSCMYSS